MWLKKAEIIAYILIAILFLIGAIIGFLIFSEERKVATPQEKSEDVNEEAQSGPQEYTSDIYNFSITIPEGWGFEEGKIGNVPAINFYPTSEGKPNQAYDHFTNTTHVSVYPQGIPTEGVFAQTRPLDITLNERVSAQARSYMLDNGDVFARYILLSDTEENWNSSGFIWTRVFVEDQQSGCITPDGYTASEECDPLMGDEIVVLGEVDTTYTDDIRSIVTSFEFIK